MRRKTVILANGAFPKKGGMAWQLLAGAKRVVACDGAASAYRRHFGRWPSVIVGDLDSWREPSAVRRSGAVRPVVVKVSDQNTNDLEKAMDCCAKRGWKSPQIVGATGKREDHALGNIFRALDHGCEMVTDRGRFVPVCGQVTLKVEKGAAVSVFAPDPATRMTSLGLEWPLDGLRFSNLHCATLNRATSSRLRLTSTRPVSVYLASPATERGAASMKRRT